MIIDDLGYIRQTREEMEVVFTLLAERYERGSVLLTSNLPFSKWEGIFKEPNMVCGPRFRSDDLSDQDHRSTSSFIRSNLSAAVPLSPK
jgi:hypothetical protein